MLHNVNQQTVADILKGHSSRLHSPRTPANPENMGTNHG